MSRLEELYKELELWREKKFYNNMEDHWSRENYKFDDQCKEKIKAIEEEIRRLKNE